MKNKKSNVRKIDELSSEKFGGNIEEALECLIKNKDPMLRECVKELNKKEASYAFRVIHHYHADRIIEENFGGKEKFAKDVMLDMRLQDLGLSKDDVRNSSKNLFAKELKTDLLKLLACIIIPPVLYLMIRNFMDANWIFVIQSIFITCFSANLATSIMKCIKFKKVKKDLMELD